MDLDITDYCIKDVDNDILDILNIADNKEELLGEEEEEIFTEIQRDRSLNLINEDIEKWEVYENRISELSNTISLLKEEIKILKEAKKENKDYKQICEDQNNEIAKLKSEIMRGLKENEKLKSKLLKTDNKYQSEVEEKNGIIREYFQKNQELISEIQQNKNISIITIDNSKLEYNKKLDAAKSEIESIRLEKSELEKLSSKYSKEIQSMKSQITELRTELDNKRNIKQLEITITDRISNIKAQYDEKISFMNEHLETYRECLIEKENQIYSLNIQLEESAKKNNVIDNCESKNKESFTLDNTHVTNKFYNKFAIVYIEYNELKILYRNLSKDYNLICTKLLDKS